MLISHILDPSIGVEWRLMVLRCLVCGGFGAGIILLAIRGFKELSGPNSVVRKQKMLAAFMMIAVVCGAIKPDGGTNSPSGGPPQQQQMMMVPRPLLMMPLGETVSEFDVDRGYRLDSVTTNDMSVYVAPSNAVYDTEWSAFGGATDSKTYDIGFDFPLGTNAYQKLNVTQNTSVRKRRRTDDVLLRVSEAISGMRRGVSAFSTWGDEARRIFNWTDCVGDPTTNLFNESAQLELHPNGDFTIRSNELAFAYRRITPFDWDDDGLANEIDPAPRTNGGDFYGQSDAWVLSNFTNAEEILSVGYTNWVDGQVGTGLANGLYKFTASFTNAPGRATLLSVGGYSVVVTNAGDYVFLLEKGPGYSFGTSPHFADVDYRAEDDIPASGVVGPRLMSAFSSQADWTIGGGMEYLIGPDGINLGYCQLLPTLCGSPGVSHLGPSSFPVTFTAVLSDCCRANDINYTWSASDGLTIESDGGPTATLSATSLPSWREAQVSVSVDCFGTELFSYLTGLSYGVNEAPQVDIRLIAPVDLLVRSCWMPGSQSASVTAVLESDVPTSGVMRVWVERGGSKLDTVLNTCQEIEINGLSAESRSFAVDGITASDTVDDVRICSAFVDASNTQGPSVYQDMTVVLPVRVEVPSAPTTGLAVLMGSSVAAQLATTPQVTSPTVKWLTSKRKTRTGYDPWLMRSNGNIQTTLQMDEAGVFAVAARTICGGGTQSNHVAYVHLADEPYIAALGEEQGPNQAGGLNHIGVASTRKLLDLRNEALTHLNQRDYLSDDTLLPNHGFSHVGAKKWKCNRFVADIAIESGIPVPIQTVIVRDWYLPNGTFPPVANDWASSSVSISGWSHLGTNAYPEPGFIAGHPSLVGSGHCGIVDYDGWTISVRPGGIGRNARKMLDGTCGYNKPEENENGNN